MHRIEEIKQLIENGEYDIAKQLLAHIEGNVGTEIEVLSLRAAISVYEQRFLDAEEYLLQALGKDEEHEDLVLNMGIVQQVLGNFEVALTYYERLKDLSNDVELQSIAEYKLNECLNELEDVRRPLVSIVLLAYNKLEYTKLCVESIFRFTSHLDIELITVNNGSTDDTHHYFNSLPYPARPLHLPRNQGPVGGFNAGMRIARGKYTAAVCNDFIFTPRWLDNLIACMESDDRIGYASPGASSISNYQQIQGEYSNLDELYAFAEQYNHSDPLKWEERVRLLPNVLMARTELLKQVDYYDTRFYYGEFADDDISFKIRRAGYKLVYCRDTFTHHFGSVTVSVDHVQNNSLTISRDIFRDKYGFDAWEATDIHPVMVESLAFNDEQTPVEILGINSNCGANPLQIRNLLRSHGITNCLITNFSNNPIYKQDLETVSDRVIEGELSQLFDLLGDEISHFSYIVMEIESEQLNAHQNLVGDITRLLNHGGQIACRFIYQELNEEAMSNDIDKIKNENFEVRRVKVNKNISDSYDVLITAQWRG